MKLIGSPKTIADKMQEWLEGDACDGFLVVAPYFPGGVETFVHLVIPELQRRGLFRTEYDGKTLRDVMGLPVPVNPNFPESHHAMHLSRGARR